MEEIDDYDMECETITTEGNGMCELNCKELDVMEGRPDTPENDLSGVGVQDYELPGTPPNTMSPMKNDSFYTPNAKDSSFISRLGIDKVKFRANPRLTSTPLFDSERLSNTLPSTFAAPNLSHLKDIFQCRSAETVRRRQSSGGVQPLKLGPNELSLMYINPFTPDGRLLERKMKAQKKFKRLSLDVAPPKFCLNDSFGSEVDLGEIPNRPRLKDFNVSRFNEEFLKLEEIGRGVHGCVNKCINRMNGCFYAIKKTLKPIRTGTQEKVVRNEVFAHGVLFHHNIVRNFSCWKEEGFVFIQNEYCNGGNLEGYMEVNSMSECLLRSLLLQIASALKYMHELGLAHMDIKPGNIFLCIEHNKENSLESDGGFGDDDKSEEITFKLGDLGHVSRLGEDDPEEGDCRYLSREIIQEDYTHLDRADIFALGLTVYEAAGGGPLPKNGDEWQEIRDGKLKHLNSLSKELNIILKRLIAPSPEKRPSASDLIEMLKPTSPILDEVSTFIHNARCTRTRLEQTALEASNLHYDAMCKTRRQLKDQQQKEKVPTPSKDKTANPGKKKGVVTRSRVVGRKTKRSSSTTLF